MAKKLPIIWPKQMQIDELIEILDRKEKKEEQDLKTEKLSLKQAMALHDEAASIIRAILDLNDILKKREIGALNEHEYGADELIKRKVDQVKNWNKLMDEIKKNGEV